MRARIGFLAALVMSGLFLAGRAVILLQGKVYTSFDTFSYAYRDDPAWDRGALVSFTGDAPRPWGVPLFFAAFPDDHSRAVGQWVIGTIVWLALAWAAASLLRHRAARLGTMAAILLIGLTRQAASWDFAILSESLAINLGVLTLSLFLWWMRTRSLWPLIGMTVAAAWWIFTRVDVFVLAAPIGVALLVYAWRHAAPRRRAAPLICAITLALAAGWSFLVVQPNTARAHAKWSFAPQLSHERGLLMYRLRISVFPDPEVKERFESRLGMPRCPGADEVAAGGEWAIERFAAEVDKCPQLRAWTDENLHGLWSAYATTEPVLFARETAQLTSQALAGAAYADTPSILTATVEKAAFPRTHSLALTLAALLLALAVAWMTGARRRHPQAFWTAAVIAVASLVSTVLTVIVSAGEVWRFGLQEAIALRIAIIILAGAALDSYLTGRAERATSTR